MNRNSINPRNLVLAGLAGGMAEVVFVTAWCAVSPLAGAAVLGGITASVFPAWAGAPFAPALGMLIHFTLSVALALAFGLAFSRTVATRGDRAVMTTSVLALAAIWAFNFFVLLPTLNASFVTLMPYGVTLISKLLFGVAMGAVLLRHAPVRIASRLDAIAAHG
jgi:hypothetical protein